VPADLRVEDVDYSALAWGAVPITMQIVRLSQTDRFAVVLDRAPER
jgi:hypothetical protein